MPASHSKRNTALAFFTSYERSLLKTAWGTQQTRLSRDSFLPFGSCQLCLLPSREPVSCTLGDIFCRECALNNLLAQKKEIARLEKDLERKLAEDSEQRQLHEGEEDTRALQEFEMVQMGLEKKRKREDEDTIAESRTAKKKFELTADDVLRAAKEERQKMRSRLDAEKKTGSNPNSSFWIPSVAAPSGLLTKDERPPKLQPLCPCSAEDKPHNISLKTLITTNFSTEQDPVSKLDVRSCPSCRKKLSNSTKAVMAVPCGHVLCKPCADKFLKPHKDPDPHNPDQEHSIMRCYVCESDLTGAADAGTNGAKSKAKSKKDKGGVKPGLIELRTDGTGFAGGGQAEVKRKGVAFQC